MLAVENLRKSFPDAQSPARTEVLRGASFTVEAGEAVAVMGMSGAGKSTLLHIIGGLEAADVGHVRIANFDVTTPTTVTADQLADYRRAHVGFVFQFHHLLPDLMAIENIAMPLLIKREARRSAFERAAELLHLIELDHRSKHLPAELSGGERQRVAVARALITNPPLILADEPTGNLDEHSAARTSRLLVELARARGAIVLIATHNPALAQLCDRTLRLHNGVIEEVGKGARTAKV